MGVDIPEHMRNVGFNEGLEAAAKKVEEIAKHGAGTVSFVTSSLMTNIAAAIRSLRKPMAPT